MKTVSEMISEHRGVYSVVPEQSVLSAAQLLRAKNIGAVAVTRNNVVLGVVSERDMLNKVLSPGLDPRDLSVSQIMSHQVTTVSPDESWEQCLFKMRTMHCRHLPVVKKDRLIGMISLRDVLGIEEAEILDAYLWDRSLRQEENEPVVKR